MDLMMLTRERIQETLDEAAERGRLTRTDANDLVSELVRKGRQQTDELVGDFEQLVGRGRDQIGSAAQRARRSQTDSTPPKLVDGTISRALSTTASASAAVPDSSNDSRQPDPFGI